MSDNSRHEITVEADFPHEGKNLVIMIDHMGNSFVYGFKKDQNITSEMLTDRLEESKTAFIIKFMEQVGDPKLINSHIFGENGKVAFHRISQKLDKMVAEKEEEEQRKLNELLEKHDQKIKKLEMKAAREKRKAERAEKNRIDRLYREQQVSKNNKGA